jgi:hypothetical protein
MQNITCAADLKNAIQSLEAEKAMSEQQLKNQFNQIKENFKPVNLIRNTINELTTEPTLIDKLISTTMGLAGGYLSKKKVVGTSHKLIRKIFGSLMEFGVTTLVAQNPETIKSITHFVVNMFRKKEINSEES